MLVAHVCAFRIYISFLGLYTDFVAINRHQKWLQPNKKIVTRMEPKYSIADSINQPSIALSKEIGGLRSVSGHEKNSIRIVFVSNSPPSLVLYLIFV